jgi:enolase-phosphatase E1
VELKAQAALIDIEGTVGSIAFVRDVLFPYAKVRLDDYVAAHIEEPEVRAILDEAAREAHLDVHDLPGILRALHDWSDRDVKVTPLKAMQGLIWAEGFTSSGIRGHLYSDAVDALHRFHDASVSLYIYSSGSIAAQKLLFGHTVAGDLLHLFSGFFDTTIGSKRDTASYERIAEEIGVAPNEIVFFSDSEAELDAAQDAGIQTVQLARPEDETTPSTRHTSIESFSEMNLRAASLDTRAASRYTRPQPQ